LYCRLDWDTLAETPYAGRLAERHSSKNIRPGCEYLTRLY
jgi:hypothetical protein